MADTNFKQSFLRLRPFSEEASKGIRCFTVMMDKTAMRHLIVQTPEEEDQVLNQLVDCIQTGVPLPSLNCVAVSEYEFLVPFAFFFDLDIKFKATPRGLENVLRGIKKDVMEFSNGLIALIDKWVEMKFVWKRKVTPELPYDDNIVVVLAGRVPVFLEKINETTNLYKLGVHIHLPTIFTFKTYAQNLVGDLYDKGIPPGTPSLFEFKRNTTHIAKSLDPVVYARTPTVIRCPLTPKYDKDRQPIPGSIYDVLGVFPRKYEQQANDLKFILRMSHPRIFELAVINDFTQKPMSLRCSTKTRLTDDLNNIIVLICKTYFRRYWVDGRNLDKYSQLKIKNTTVLIKEENRLVITLWSENHECPFINKEGTSDPHVHSHSCVKVVATTREFRVENDVVVEVGRININLWCTASISHPKDKALPRLELGVCVPERLNE